MNPVSLDSARLLARAVPPVLIDDTFVLNGSTAINLFVCDMPRSRPGACRSGSVDPGAAALVRFSTPKWVG